MSIHSQKRAKVSHIVGIDFGTAKIGLAMADSETKIAFAYATLKNDKKFLEKLAAIIQKESIETIVIGTPMSKNFRNQKNKEIYEKLGEKIRKIFPRITLEYQNEMFSTKIAQDNLKEKGVKKIKRFDDQEAARVILQSWLEKSG